MESSVGYLILMIMAFTTNVVDSGKKYRYWETWKPGTLVPIYAILASKHYYVGRVKLFNGQIIAMIDTKKNVAIAVQNRKLTYTIGIQVLCSKHPEKLYWTRIDWLNLPKNFLDDALVGGFQKDIGSYLYIGRITHDKQTKVGRAIPLNRDGPGLWIWDDEEALRVTIFDLLKINMTGPPL